MRVSELDFDAGGMHEPDSGFRSGSLTSASWWSARRRWRRQRRRPRRAVRHLRSEPTGLKWCDSWKLVSSGARRGCGLPSRPFYQTPDEDASGRSDGRKHISPDWAPGIYLNAPCWKRSNCTFSATGLRTGLSDRSGSGASCVVCDASTGLYGFWRSAGRAVFLGDMVGCGRVGRVV